MSRVLLVDDETDFAAASARILEASGHDVVTVGTLSAARLSLERRLPDTLLLDLMLPDGNGLELLEHVPGTGHGRVVLITGQPGIKSSISCLVGPGIRYLTKPIGASELLEAVRGPDRIDAPPEAHYGLLVGEHERMRAVYGQIEYAAKSSAPVLVVGETGTGKELVAAAIHARSGRRGRMVPVNGGALSAGLAGSELFGHERGSFTGAVRAREGVFKRADGGTAFLDELTEVPIRLQPHFLRVLETGRMLPVGSEREVSVDVRVIAATNRDPIRAVQSRLLRHDLFYRLNALPIWLPPLRDRRSDIPLLVQHFLAGLHEAGGPERYVSRKGLRQLEQYEWPGNVRELKHVVHRAAIMTDLGRSQLELPARFDVSLPEVPASGFPMGRSIKNVEKELIERTLEHFDGDKRAAAQSLGISLATLYARLKIYRDGSGPGAL